MIDALMLLVLANVPNVTGVDEFLQVNDTCITKLLYDHLSKVTEQRSDSIVVTIFPYALVVTSLVCTFFGRQIMKPSIALIGFFGGSLAIIQFLYSITDLHEKLECYAIVGMCVVVGFCAALLMSCLVKAAAFILGATTGGIVMYSIFDAFPSLDYPVWAEAPIILNFRLFQFWTITAIVSLIGGIGARRKYKDMMSLITSTIGAWGAVLGMRMIFNENNISISEPIYMSSFCVLAITGMLVQYCRKKRSDRRKEREEQTQGIAIVKN